MSVVKSVGDEVLRLRSFSGVYEYAESIGREIGSFLGVFLIGGGKLRSFLESRREKPLLLNVSISIVVQSAGNELRRT